MVGWEVLVKAATAAVTATFASTLLMGDRRRPPHVFLAFFLLLISGNQLAEALRSMAGSGEEALFWFRTATVFASLDPLVLYYFGSVFPERNALGRPRYLVPVGVVSVGLAVSIVPATLGGAGGSVISLELHEWTRKTLTLVTYSAVLLHLLRVQRSEGYRDSHALLFAALCVATIPVWPGIVGGLRGVIAPSGVAPEPVLRGTSIFLMTVTSVALLAWTVRWAGGRRQDPTYRSTLYAVALGTAFALWRILPSASKFVESIGAGFGVEPLLLQVDAVTAGRWTAFSALASVAVVRHDLLSVGLATRRRAARVLIGAGVLAGALVVLLGAEGITGRVEASAIDVLLLVLIVASAQGFQRAIDRLAELVYGVPPPGDDEGALALYEQAARQALEEGRPLGADDDLARLREDLGLGTQAAEAIHAKLSSGSDEPLRTGAVVEARYKVARLLGQGGQARVFLAFDELLEREVVLKELHAGSADIQEKALEEARIAGGLEHPNVVTVYDVIDRGERGFLLVTEHVAGGSLEDRLTGEGPPRLEEGLDILSGVLEGLAAVHAEDVVHKDLKPANVLLTADGTPKLADFGVARVRTSRTRTRDIVGKGGGTPAFMAPEQLAGEPATPASDLYAVGRLMEELLGERAPPSLEEVRRRAMAQDPDERWSSATEMREAIEAAAEQVDA